jgi:hypothetical protein
MKAYEFTIRATKSERGAIEGMVITYPMDRIHSEAFVGSLDGLSERIKEVKAQLLSERTFESGKGFSIDGWLRLGQRKPAGYDKRRRERCDNFIAS